MKKKFGIIALTAILIFTLCAGVAGCKNGCSPKQPDIIEPDDPDNPDVPEVDKIVLSAVADASNVKLVADEVKAYLNAATVEEQIAALPKAKLAQDKGALPVKLSWQSNGSVKYELRLADNENFINAKTYEISGLQSEISVYNLLPSTTYYWKVSGDNQGDESQPSTFTTEKLSVRLIYAEGTSNVRDIGGWAAGSGKVNYGKIYRGNQLNGFGSWGDNKLTENGLKTFASDLNIKAEIDLRTQGKDDADQTENFVNAAYPYYKYTIGQYTDIFEARIWNSLPNDGKTKSDTMSNTNDARRLSYATGNAVRNENAMKLSLKNIFDSLADENNYPVYIHCNAGADRTGTVAFLLNGLLGVSESDLIKDFELTSFSKVSGLRYRSELKDGAFTEIGVMKNDYDNFVAFGALINAIKTNYGEEGKPLSAAIENFLTDYVGVSRKNIEKIKKIMLSDYAPSDVLYVDGERQVIEVSKTENVINLGDISYTSVTGVSLNGINLGTSLSAINGSELESVYGERELTVTVGTESGVKTVRVPVLIVSRYIYAPEDFIEALEISKTRNYGYYELKNDITLTEFSNAAKEQFTGKNGFCGVFEGNNHTITSVLGNHGLFGYVSGGAEIRNVKFAVNGAVNEAGKSVIADYILDSFITNVEITVSGGTLGIGSDGIGLITAKAFKGNSVKGLTVNAQGAELNSLFGSADKYAFERNYFSGCVVNAKRVKELASYNANGNRLTVYLEDTVGFGGNITGVIETNVADIINVNESFVELNIGERFNNAQIITLECNGVAIKDYKFENGVLRLFNDINVFGNNLGKTVIEMTYKGVNGITFGAKIGAVIFTDSEKVVLTENQNVFIGRTENSIDLKEYSGATVYSISCGGYYLGNDASSLDLDGEFKTNKTVHGNNTVSALIEKDGRFYSLQIPVTVITAEISDVSALKELLDSDSAEYAVYGYYKLISNLGDASYKLSNGNGKNWQNVDGLYGFRGTLDGNGNSISGTAEINGLFGLVGKGAVIKNLTVNAYGYSDGRTVFARSVRDAAFENVTVNIKSGESSSETTEGGVITGLMSHSTEYKNVEINSDGDVDTLFGCSYWNYDHRKANVFSDCRINVKSIGGLLCVTTSKEYLGEKVIKIESVEGITLTYVRYYESESNVAVLGASAEFSIGENNSDVTEITSVKIGERVITGFNFANGKLTLTESFNDSEVGVQVLTLSGKIGNRNVMIHLTVTVTVPAEEVGLTGIREIVLTSGNDYTLDLGEYSAATGILATIGGEKASYNNGKLTLTKEYKENLVKHGEQTLKVIVQKGGKYYAVTTKVLVITKEISTFDELKTALKFNNNVKFGYYRLKNNLIGYNWYQSENDISGGIWKNANGELGFRGTFDGNGYSVRETFNITGLFGYVGKGAVIKNVTFNMNVYRYKQEKPESFMLFGYSMIGATIDNVNVNVDKRDGNGITEIRNNFVSGLLTGIFSYGNTFNKLTINAQETDIDTLFGSCAHYGYPPAYTENTFTGCKVKVKSLLGLACTNNAEKTILSAAGVSGLTVSVPRADETATEKLTIGQAYEYTLAGVAEIAEIKLGENAFTAYTFNGGVLTINADAFNASDVSTKTFAITAKNEKGYFMYFNLTVAVDLDATPVNISGTKEIVLTNGNDYALDLGEYSRATAHSVTIGGENATYNNGTLTLSDEYKANQLKHGEQPLVMIVEKDGAYYRLTATVLVVTKEITSFDELKSALYLSFKNNVTVRYGYYRLMKDLSSSGWYQSGYDELTKLASNPENGFRGTFDGNGKKIQTFVAEPGIFGIIGNGAVIKKLTIEMSRYESRFMALGFSMIGATLENVTISAKAGTSSDGTVVYDGVTAIPTNSHSGLVTSLGAYNNNFINVTVNAGDVNVDTLFGSCAYSYGYPAGYTENTFTKCTVKVKSLLGLACTNNADKTVTPYTGVSGLDVYINGALA